MAISPGSTLNVWSDPFARPLLLQVRLGSTVNDPGARTRDDLGTMISVTPEVYGVPRILHQVWINDREPALPEPFRAYRDAWQRLHPQWDYFLWNLENIDFELRRPELLPRCTGYAQMADVLRLEVLYRFGGVYVDTDFEPLRPIDQVFDPSSNHFFCSEDGLAISTGIMGSTRGSPLISRLLDALPEELGNHAPNIETGPVFVTRQLLSGGFAPDVQVAPTAWFYPYNWDQPHLSSGPFPEAYAVHRWAHSWKVERSYRARVMRALRFARRQGVASRRVV